MCLLVGVLRSTLEVGGSRFSPYLYKRKQVVKCMHGVRLRGRNVRQRLVQTCPWEKMIKRNSYPLKIEVKRSSHNLIGGLADVRL